MVCSDCGHGCDAAPHWQDGAGGWYCNTCQILRFQVEGGWDLTMPPFPCDSCGEGYPPKLLTVRDEQAICYRCHRAELAAKHAEVICSCRRWLPLTVTLAAVLLLLFP